jgi:hypothetical protein
MLVGSPRSLPVAAPLGLLGLALGFALGSGCAVLAEHHCGNLDGDLTCAERGGGGFCDACRAQGDGCSDAMPSDGCHFVGPGAGPGEASLGTTESDDDSYGEVSTEEGGPETTTGPAPCTSDADCGDATPFCQATGACVACDDMPVPDAACAGQDESRPLCVDGECVQCSEANTAVCDVQRQICDPETHACTGCVQHAQCESEACELAVERCFPADAVVLEVDDAPDADHATVVGAVAAIANGSYGILRVHERSAGAAYQAAHVIDASKTIALLGAPGEAPFLQGAAGAPALHVEGIHTAVYIDGLALRDTAEDGRGLVVREGTAWVERSRILQNTGGGVLAEAGAMLTIRSSFVGGDVADVTAVEVQGATAQVLYATLGAGIGSAAALVCDPTATVDVRNSVLVARTLGPAVSCDAGTFTHDAAEADLEGTNTAVGAMSVMWFQGYLLGELGLSAVGADVFANVAQWREGDPLADIDGDPRPAVDGAPDHAGADVP